jgi:hypothetical protein
MEPYNPTAPSEQQPKMNPKRKENKNGSKTFKIYVISVLLQVTMRATAGIRGKRRRRRSRSASLLVFIDNGA